MGKVVLILAVTSAGLGLVSLHLVKQLREGDAIIAELKTQVTSLQEQAAAQREAVASPTFAPPPAPVIAEASEPTRSAASAQSKDVPKIAAVQALGAAASTISARPSREEGLRMMREHRERQRQLMQDPEYREAMRLQSRSNLARQYPGVIQELGLDQAQADEFFTMLTDQQMRVNEQMQSLWELETTEDRDPAAVQQRQHKMQQAAAEIQRNNEAEIAARFGQQKFQAWKEYQSTIGQRHQLEHMRSTLAAQGLPLTDDLSRPMLKALAEAHKLDAQEYAAAANRAGPAAARAGANLAFQNHNMEQQIESTRKRNQRMLDAISSYLTFEQRQALEREQEAQIKMQEAQLRLMRARGDANPAGTFYAEGNRLIAVQPLQ